MDARPISIGSLFSSKIHLFAPTFQRPYVWSRNNNWEPLWEDVVRLAEELLDPESERVDPHFLGAIVVEQSAGPTGIEARQLIDGQQRLTTIQILFAVLRDVCEELGGEDGMYPDFSELAENRNLYRVEDQKYQFKVWPTLQDRDAFRAVVEAGSASNVREHWDAKPSQLEVDSRLASAYLFFDWHIRDWLHSREEPFDALVDALWQVMQNKLLLVSIELNEHDNAQVIFETLNARGTPLLQSDLVKNYLFYEAEGHGLRAEALHREYWSGFEPEDDNFWRETVRQGRLKRPRLDAFLQYFLTMKTGRDVPATRLFESYKRFVSDHVSSRSDVESQFAELRKYGSVFQTLFRQPPNSREGIFLERLDVLDYSTAYPFLMLAYGRLHPSDKEQLRGLLTVVESFLVRRMVCGLTAKNYNKLFAEACSTLRDTEDLRDGFVSFLLAKEGDAVRWPDDEEFQEAWLTTPVYAKLAQKRIRMLLWAIEKEQRTNRNEDFDLDYHKLTIEHLLPVGWDSADWPLPEGKERDVETNERRNRLLHSIGNLTLLTQSLNSSASNGPWETKRTKLTEDSALSLNRALCNDERWDEWDESQILARSEDLFESAREVWPYATSWTARENQG